MTTPANLADQLRKAATKVGEDLWFPADLAYLRQPLVAWLRDEAHAIEDNPGRYCGAALDMARAINGEVGA